MTFVTLLRRLWHHKVLLSLALIAGIAVGISLAYRVTGPFRLESRDYRVGVASARVLVDTPRSQVVDLGTAATGDAPAVDIGVLSARANLLANLMTSSPIKDDVATAAGVADGTLLTPGNPSDTGTLAGEDLKPSSPRASILRASVPTLAAGQIPIIVVETQAPDPAVAAKIADQSVVILTRQLDSLAGSEAVPADRRVTIRELGPARSAVETRGPSRLLAAVGGLFTFLGGCVLILLVAALVSGWRGITAQERSARVPAVADAGRKGDADEEDGDEDDDAGRSAEVIELDESRVLAARLRGDGGWRSRPHDAG